MAVVTICLSAAALLLGAAGLSTGETLAAVIGRGDATALLVVRQLRVPRIVAAVATGAGFGLSGALFQSALRNPLASPDILGIAGGASLGAVWALLVAGLGGVAVSGAAAVGALAFAAAIWLLARRHGLQGLRFVLVGIGFAYLASSLVAWLLARAQEREAAQALLWTVGSVGDVRAERLTVVLVTVVVLGLLALREGPRLRILALGDEQARGLGQSPAVGHSIVLLVGVGLVAAATSVAGPVPFVALIAPAIARRLVDDGGPAVATSALTGAVVMLAADTIGQHFLPADITAPVGIVTGLIGAPWLAWLLWRTERGVRP